MPILQPIKSFDYVGACRYTGYVARSIRLTLKCGHEQTRKASAGVPKRAQCKECEFLAAGGTITFGEAD
jgi:hypothetical protein